MKFQRRHLSKTHFAALAACLLATEVATAQDKEKPMPKVLSFAGYEWEVKNRADLAGPGPNLWDERNVWIDDTGALHLKLAQRDGKWTCAELTSKNRFGFGRYGFKVEGAIDKLDPQVVLGLFLYPTPDVGPDGTHEIDIEFARWGKAENPPGNYSVWPVQLPPTNNSHRFPIALEGTFTTHNWTWRANEVTFQSHHGHRDDDASLLTRWKHAPEKPEEKIAQKPMPLHFNLWLFRGKAPTDGKEVEVVIRDFKFEPLEARPTAK